MKPLCQDPLLPLFTGWYRTNQFCLQFCFVALMICGNVFSTAAAQEFSANQLEQFEKRIRPLLIEHCLECHGAKKQEGGLNVSTRENLKRGGDSGAAFDNSNPDQSLLVHAISYLGEPKMPPKGKLSDENIKLIREWIHDGAPWPANSPLTDEVPSAKQFEVSEKQKNWWAFQPVRQSSLPSVQNESWVRNEIDRFILAKLDAEKLTPNVEADRITWLRRATFDLTGLPPTPKEIDDFQRDESSNAYEKVVDRLLDSPAYGQRWARHWLDVARYADYYDPVPGMRTASCELTEAWRYRDWVVDSFNRDLPFDQFIVHQIAGDQLPSPTGAEIYPEGLIATTFLSNGVWDRGDADKEKIISDMVDDNIGVIGKAFLGLTLDCARCHDHKFDPISTEDYYALAGMFYSSHILKDLGAKGAEYVVNRVPLIGPTELAARTAIEKQISEISQQIVELDRIDRLEKMLAGGHMLQPIRFTSEAGADGKVAEDHSIFVTGNLAKDQYQVEFEVPAKTPIRYIRLEALPHETLPHRGPGRAGDGNFVITKISLGVRKKDQAEDKDVRLVSAVADFEQTGLPASSSLDDDFKDGWAVSPNFGTKHVALFEITSDFQIEEGDHLTVYLKQQHTEAHNLGHFRISFVENWQETPPSDSEQRKSLIAKREELQKEIATPSPFAMAVTEGGTPGGLFPGIQDVPIHIRGSYAKLGQVVPRRLPKFLAGENQVPIEKGSGRLELAKWVASPTNPLTARVIVNRVWHWHFGAGLVSTPSNFGLLSQPPSHPELLDWLAASFLEDGWSLKKLHKRIMLSATYRLSSKAPANAIEQDPENKLYSRFVGKRLEAEAIRDAILFVNGQLEQDSGGPAGDDFTIKRRSIYVQTARWQRDSYANLFDAANPDSSTERRTTSTVAPQALLLMNHPWTQEQAKFLVERIYREAPEDDSKRLDHLYSLLLGRFPNESERQIARELIACGDPSLERSGWIDLAHVLICSNEFIYVD